jgi:arginyl-tRNA synthetase
MAEALRITKALQEKKEPYIGVWHKLFKVSVAGMKKNFEALNVHFDLWLGEASVQDLIAPMVVKLTADGFAKISNGATIIDVTQEGDKKELPPLLLLKSDGAAMYGTTDLATIVDRIEKFDLARIVYIVDQRQSLHFEQVFRAAYKSKLVPEGVELTHAGFGTMNGIDGKPFKTRTGGVMKLNDLISMGIEKAQERLKEANLSSDIGVEERDEIAQKVAIAAIKFADLQNQRQSNYVFDLDRLTSFEGKTGPYLLYQAVRINSLLKKAGEFDKTASLSIQSEDRALALMLTEFPDALSLTMRNYAPHYLCEYVYKLSQAFSSFYGSCHILSEENEALRNSRLNLCEMSVRKIELILSLLGIEIPERM